MNKISFKNIAVLLSTVFFISFVVSCEEDFTDIRTNIVGNNDFTTNDTVFNVTVGTKDIENVRADGLALGGVLGQYLLGVYNNENYEKIEASIITQLDIPFDLAFDNQPLGADNDTISSIYTIDTAFLKIPYQATFTGTSGAGPIFELDSIIGNVDVPFTLNVFRLSSYLNELDPNNPAAQNTFYSDHQYDLFTEKLNVVEDYQLRPRNQDTVQFVLRRKLNNEIYQTDSVSLTNSNPYIAIPIKKSIIQQEFIDKYSDTEFLTQEAFNNFFRGLFIEATGNDGSLISFNFNTTDPLLTPSLEIFYTRTSTITGNNVQQDSITPLTDSFGFNQIRNHSYKMTPGNALTSNQARVQGTAGSYATIDLFGDDNDLNGIPDQLDFLRTQNWLINDARITLYVDQNTVGTDTVATPFRLFLFKDGVTALNQPNQSQILDIITEGTVAVDGNLRLDSDRKPDRYVFNLTDYISELVSGNIDYLPTLGVKVLNPTDLPTTAIDTIIRTYNWNPKAVMLLNHLELDENRRPQIKISYAKKIDD